MCIYIYKKNQYWRILFSFLDLIHSLNNFDNEESKWHYWFLHILWLGDAVFIMILWIAFKSKSCVSKSLICVRNIKMKCLCWYVQKTTFQKTPWQNESQWCNLHFGERVPQKNQMASLEQNKSRACYFLNISNMFASLHLQAEWSGWVLWAEESGGYPQAHTQAPSREERLSTELQELQTYREGEQPTSTATPNRMKLLGNVVWARLQIVHYSTKS